MQKTLWLAAILCFNLFAQTPAAKKYIYLSSDTLVVDEERKNADQSPSNSFTPQQGNTSLGNLMANAHTPLLGKYGNGSYVRIEPQENGALAYFTEQGLKEFDPKNPTEKQTILEVKNYLKGKTLDPTMVKFVKKYFPEEKIEKTVVGKEGPGKADAHGGGATAKNPGVETYKLSDVAGDPLCKDGKCEVPKDGIVQASGKMPNIFDQAPKAPSTAKNDTKTDTAPDSFYKKLESEDAFNAALEKAKVNGQKTKIFPPIFFTVSKDKGKKCPLCDVVDDYMKANKDALDKKVITYQLDPSVQGNAQAIAKNRAYFDAVYPGETMYFGTAFRYDYNPTTKKYEFDQTKAKENIFKSGFVTVQQQVQTSRGIQFQNVQAPNVPLTAALDKQK